MHDQSAPESSPTLAGIGSRELLTAAAIAGYGLMVLGGFVPAMTGAAVSAVAMVALGAALYISTNARLGPVTVQPRLAGRAQAAQRRYRTLAIASAGALYLALVVGALVTDRRAVWDCLALPFCPAPSDLALIAMTHRVLAALVTLLMAILAFQTWRVRPERALRRAASWSFGLMLLQNAVGIMHLLLVRDRNDIAFMTTHGAHLALGAITWALLVVLATRALRPPLVSRDAGEQSSKVSNNPFTASAVQLFHGSAARMKDYMSLTKPGVITLLMLTTLAAMYITPAGLPSPELMFWTMLGGWLMPSGAHALNCYFDRDIDMKMGRTGRRPLPGNRIPAWHALVLGIVLAVLRSSSWRSSPTC